jgi:hypothetical protein
MKNTILRKGSVAVAVLGIGALLSACGGSGGSGGGGSGSSSSSGSGFTTTSAYIQDDVSNFPNVTVGIYSISLANTGDGKACILFSSSTPVYINLASLSGIAQYISTTACPSDSAYNRLDIVLSNTVSVITPVTYSSTMCSLTSYNPNANPNVTLPNTVNCGSGSTCLLDMTGNIGALSGTNSYVDIDFDLKNSYMIISGNSCQFSFATRPITVENENEPSNAMLRLRGYVRNLSTTAFNIVKDDNSYTVVYSSLTSSVSSLLQSASSNSLKVAVVCSSFTNNICTASIITQTVGGVYNSYTNGYLTLAKEDNTALVTIPLFNPTIYPTSYTWSSFTSGSSYLLDVNKCSASNCTSSVYFTGNIMLEDDND